MHWLIDGYNLIRQVEFLQAEEHNKGLAAGREALLGLLSDFASRWVRDRGRVTVVFDGPSSGRFPSPTPSPAGVRTIFSRGQTADQVIEEIIDASVNPADITVVSADGEIKRFAKRHRCATLSPTEFLEKAAAPEQPRGAKPSLNPDRQRQIESELRKRWVDSKKDGVRS